MGKSGEMNVYDTLELLVESTQELRRGLERDQVLREMTMICLGLSVAVLLLAFILMIAVVVVR